MEAVEHMKPRMMTNTVNCFVTGLMLISKAQKKHMKSSSPTTMDWTIIV